MQFLLYRLFTRKKTQLYYSISRTCLKPLHIYYLPYFVYIFGFYLQKSFHMPNLCSRTLCTALYYEYSTVIVQHKSVSNLSSVNGYYKAAYCFASVMI